MLQTLRENYRFLIFEGIMFVILGMICFFAPFIAGISFGIFLGIILIVLGVIQAFRVSKQKSIPGNIITILGAILLIIVGIGLLAEPYIGLLTISLLLSILFFLDGCFRIILSFQHEFFSKRTWYIINGVLEIIIALLIWNQWPYSTQWFIGFLVGANFLVVGITQIMLANEVKNLPLK